MDFSSFHQVASSIALVTTSTFGTFLLNQAPAPTPSPQVKPIIHQEVKVEPVVTVEKFIGPTIEETENKAIRIKNQAEKESTSSTSLHQQELQSLREVRQLADNEAISNNKTIDQPKIEKPTPILPPPPNSQNFDLIWQMENDHRAKIGLPAFEKDERLCKIAESRGPQLQNEVFGSGTIHQGMRDMNLPYWNTENVVAYETEQKNFDWWMNDGIHRQAIESNNKYSCGTCFGNICVQEFSSFTPK